MPSCGHPETAVPDGLWLNIGCGPSNPAGWINIDGSWQVRLARYPAASRALSRVIRRPVGDWPAGIVHHDLRRGLRFGDGSAAVVYSSHLLEHLYRDEAVKLLGEARRVLRPGGICRIVVPDVRQIVRWYLESPETGDETSPSSSDILMDMMMVRPHGPARLNGGLLMRLYRRVTHFDAHKWMYDGAGLRQIFREAGFEAPAERRYLESSIARERLQLVEARDRLCEGAGVCVEARA